MVPLDYAIYIVKYDVPKYESSTAMNQPKRLLES